MLGLGGLFFFLPLASLHPCPQRKHRTLFYFNIKSQKRIVSGAGPVPWMTASRGSEA